MNFFITFGANFRNMQFRKEKMIFNYLLWYGLLMYLGACSSFQNIESNQGGYGIKDITSVKWRLLSIRSDTYGKLRSSIHLKMENCF
jgi:hypothetical protein